MTGHFGFASNQIIKIKNQLVAGKKLILRDLKRVPRESETVRRVKLYVFDTRASAIVVFPFW